MVHALVDAGERVVVLDNLTTGFQTGATEPHQLVIGETGDQTRRRRVDRGNIGSVP